MPGHSLPRTMLLIAGLLVFAAGRSAAQAPAGQPTEAPTQTPAKAPPLMISPGAYGGAQLYQSWPLVLDVTLWTEPPDEGAPAPPPLTLTAKQGAWCEALVVTIKDATGVEAKWPLHLVKSDEAQLALDPIGGATVEWWLAPEETQTLAEGDYTITVAFDPQKVDGLPTEAGAVQVDSFTLQVAKEPVPLSPEFQQDKLYETARLSLMRGDLAAAADLGGKLLALDPESIPGLRIQAAVLARQGKPRDALALLNKALDTHDRRNPGGEPPVALLAERDEILQTLGPPPTVKSDQAPK